MLMVTILLVLLFKAFTCLQIMTDCHVQVLLPLKIEEN